MGDTTTVALTDANKGRLDDVGEEAFNDSTAKYNSIIGFLINFYYENK